MKRTRVQIEIEMHNQTKLTYMTKQVITIEDLKKAVEESM
jgi:hypothetical protein